MGRLISLPGTITLLLDPRMQSDKTLHLTSSPEIEVTFSWTAPSLIRTRSPTLMSFANPGCDCRIILLPGSVPLLVRVSISPFARSRGSSSTSVLISGPFVSSMTAISGDIFLIFLMTSP